MKVVWFYFWLLFRMIFDTSQVTGILKIKVAQIYLCESNSD